MRTHQQCPDCGHDKCLTIFDDGGTYCHSCQKSKGGADIAEVAEVFMKHRGISPEVAKKYGVTTGVSDTGDVKFRKYPYPHGDKFRFGKKDFGHNKGLGNDYLFGLDKFDPGSHKTITIVEGEEDTLATYEMLKKAVPVVGLPGSSIKRSMLEGAYEKLNSFERIVLVPDNDKAGEKIIDPFVTLFPNKTFIVSLDKYKDPNEYLLADEALTFQTIWKAQRKATPEKVYNTPEQFKQILSEKSAHHYLKTPFESLNEMIKGLMQGHLTVITGQEGKGKTEILRAFEYEIILNNPDVPIAVCHLEESKETYLRTLASYYLDKNVRDPDTSVPEKDIQSAVETLTKDLNLYLFDFTEDLDPMVMLDKVRYFKEACGCKYIFLDPIQQLAYSHDSQVSEEQVLSKLSVKLEKLSTDLNVGIILTAHVNDEGATRSSRMIGKSASVRLDLQRDHMAEDEEVRNTTHLYVSKNRPAYKTGYAGSVIFDSDSFTIKEG